MSRYLLLIISIIVIGCVYVCYSSIRDTNKLQEGLANQGACDIDIGLAYLADGPSGGYERTGGACTDSAASGATYVTAPCKSMDGRYSVGDPRRYTGGWALENEGYGTGAKCETLCQSQPECKEKGMTCFSVAPGGGRCYCSFGGYECSIAKQCDKNADCIAYGQQSNGCWHTLKWDSTETGANKKTKSMYPDYFKVTKPPTAAQCQIGGDAGDSSTANSGYLGGYIYKTEAAADAACKAKGWKGLCQKVDVPPKCATGWYAGATTSTVGFHMDKDTAGFGDEGCGGGSTAWKNYWPGAAGAYCCERAPTTPPAPPAAPPAAPPSTKKPLTTDVPVYISNPAAAAAGLGIYLQNTAATGKLEHSSTRNANFILRYPFKSTGPGYFCPTEKNCPLKYTDLVIIQWAEVNNGGRIVDQPDGDTPGCGWYGCRVLQPPSTTNSTLTPLFGHGGADPAIFMLMAPPSVTMAKGTGAPTAVQAKLPIYSGDSFCLQYAGTLKNHASVNWGMTSNCGWYGCRVLTDFLKNPPSGADGDFGWEHGGGSDPAPSGGPTGWPNGPTVFKIEQDAATGTGTTPPTTSDSTPPCVGGSPKSGPLPCSCISNPKLQCYDKDGNYNSACCGIGCTGCDGTKCPASFGPGGNRSCDKPPPSQCSGGAATMGAWQEYTEPETPGTKANGWSRMISPDGKIGYVTGKGPCKPGYFWNTPQGKCYYSACPSGTQYQWVDGAKGNPSYQNPDSLPSCLCQPDAAGTSSSQNKCWFKITGDCKSFPNMNNHDWFLDSKFGGAPEKPDASQANCDARKKSWEQSCGSGATIDEYYGSENKSASTTPSINTPCDSDKILKKGNPDPNGTGNITTEMNPEGIKIFNQDVTKIFNPTTGDGKVYFYPEQPTGQDLFADPISSKTRDSNGTLYLHTHMNPNGLRIRESAADCFSDSTTLYVGGPPTKPLPSWCTGTGWDDKTTKSGCKWSGVANTDPTSCVYQQQQWCTTGCEGTWVGPNDKKSPWCIDMGKTKGGSKSPPPTHDGGGGTGGGGTPTSPQSKCTGLTGAALTACQCVENLPAGQCNWGNWSTGVYQKCQLGQSGWTAAGKVAGSAAVADFCNTYNKHTTPVDPHAGIKQNASGPCDPGNGQMSCCTNCGGVKLNTAGAGLSNTAFANICKTRGNSSDCAAAGGTWKVDPNTITSEKACTAAGGSYYAYCSTNDVHYCHGPCTGQQTCASNSGLKYNACAGAQTYSGDTGVKTWKKTTIKGADHSIANGTYTKSGENHYGAIWLKTGCQIERNEHAWYISCPPGSAPIYAAVATDPDYPPNSGWYKQRTGAGPVNVSPQDNGTTTNIIGDEVPVKCPVDYDCPDKFHRKSPMPATCPDTGCEPQDCCNPNTYCTSMGTCPPGRQMKPGAATIMCAGAQCQDKECCEPIPHEKCTNFPCPQNYSLKSGSASITCAAVTCADEECCVPDPKPTCGSDPVLCPYGYEDKPDLQKISCATYNCTEADCCIAEPPKPNITDVTKTSEVDNRQWINNSQRTHNIDHDDHQVHNVVQHDPRVFSSATEISNPGRNSVFYPGATFIVINNKDKKGTNPNTYMHYDAWGTPKMPHETRTNNMFSGYGSPSSHFTGPVNNDDPFATMSPSSDSTQFGPTAFNTDLYIKN